ncbi:MAG: glycosyltransferase family 4 protein [Patescibacteria group bacterium]|jgi:glycosyltransferase involved in cell wall biosynthesis
MKIHIQYKFKDGPYGGGNQFLKALKRHLEQIGVYEADPWKADIVLFNSFPFDAPWSDTQLIIKLKQKGKTIIHRIDGPISGYRGHHIYIDKSIYQLNNVLADGTVFQSEFSQNENKKLGLKTKIFETVIYNAADPEIFHPRGRIVFDMNRKLKIIATSWSPNQNKGFAAYQWLDQHLDTKKYEMIFIGNSPTVFKRIKHIPPVDSYKLAEYLRQSDVYLSASMNDPCSNSLIEALQCGLPAIVLKSGGHPELIRDAGLTFNKPEETSTCLDIMSSQYERHQKAIVSPSIRSVVNQYQAFAEMVHTTRTRQTTGPSFTNRMKLDLMSIAYLIRTRLTY